MALSNAVEPAPALHFRVVDVQPHHVDELCLNMRLADRREVTLQSPGKSLLKIVHDAIEISVFAHCLLVNNRVVAVWGLAVPLLLGSTGSPWAMTTDLIEDHPRMVAKLTRYYVKKLMEITPKLVADVHSDHLDAVRWLRWAGFDVSEGADLDGFLIARMEEPQCAPRS